MKVLISGAGIAGPTLAYWLSKTGAQITVLEKAKSLLSQGQNIDITCTARHVIKKMGLKDEVLKHNTTEGGSKFYDQHGKTFAPFPVHKGATNSLTSEWEILRGDLATILFKASEKLPNVTYRFGTVIDKIISNDEKAITVQLNDGTTETYDVCVLADGQWSKLRKQVFPSDCLTIKDLGSYVAYFTIPRLPEDDNWWNIYFALGCRVLTMRPDPYGSVRCCFSYMPTTDEEKQRWQTAARAGRDIQQQLVIETFADAGWQSERFLGEMSKAKDFYFQSMQQIKMSTWYQGRVVLAGDTAHCPTPLTGMGTSLALNGPYVLAGELSRLQENDHPSKAFQAYEDAYKPWVETIQEVPFFVPSIAHPATPYKRWLLQWLLTTISTVIRLPYIKNLSQGRDDEEDFKLPRYPVLEQIAKKEKIANLDGK